MTGPTSERTVDAPETTTAPATTPCRYRSGAPPHNAGWAVAALLFFWPLSFSAFSHAFNVYPLWAAGDFAGAQYASDRVRRLGQLSLWIFGGLLLLFGVLYAISLIVSIAQRRYGVGPTRNGLRRGLCGWPPRPEGSSARRAVRTSIAGSAWAASARSADGL